MAKPFNFIVGYYYGDGLISAYTYHGEVHQATCKKGAQNFLDYVKSQSPDHDWQIIKIPAPTAKEIIEEALKIILEKTTLEITNNNTIKAVKAIEKQFGITLDLNAINSD
jgi:hypothetical protein